MIKHPESWTSYQLLAAILLPTLILAWAIRQRNSNNKYPPGPKGLPILGNLFQLSSRPWIEFETFKKQYGSLVYLNIVGQSVIISNTHAVAFDLLDRRAGIYSDRPQSIVTDALTNGLYLPFTRYGPAWLKLRRAGHAFMSKAAAPNYHGYQFKSGLELTQAFLRNPCGGRNQILKFIESSVNAMVYDQPPREGHVYPKMINFSGLIVQIVAHIFNPVEVFPLLRYAPSWLAGWKRRALGGFAQFSEVSEELLDNVAKRVDAGDDRPSMAGSLLREKEKHGLTNLETAWLCGTALLVGTETSTMAMCWFIYAMMAYPDKQKKVQEELDAVVGRSRMPTFADMEKLPYLRATVREVVRWRPSIPVGARHYTTKDDVYHGYFIPKGTVCFTNVWSINHDPEVYGEDAEHFNPDRFIDKNGELLPAIAATKDGHVSFGFGPRICLGRHVANDTLFINIACLLWVATISPAIDPKTGEPEELDKLGLLNVGLLIRPSTLNCVIKPRFEEAEVILAQTRELCA